MNSDFRKIFSRLKKEDVFVKPETLRRHHVQGFVSKVYTADSNKGKLIIHLNTIHPEHGRQRMWKKVWAIGKFLDRYPKIPSAHVFLSGTIGGKKYFIVQEFFPGNVAGELLRKGNVFVSEWKAWSRGLETDIEKTIARINSIPVKGAGWIVKRGGSISGKYKTWDEFLEREVPLWLKQIRKTEGNSKFSDEMMAYLRAHKAKFKIKKSVLVHADITNPGNILVKNGRVSGFIDWEWSVAGDPAWEFAFGSRYSLNTYFKSFSRPFSERRKKDFRERVKLYEPILLTCYLYYHSYGNTIIYRALKNHLMKLGFRFSETH